MHGFTLFITGVVGAVIVGAAISAPTFIREKELQELRSSCWSQSAQDTFSELAGNIVRDEVGSVSKSSGGGLSRLDIVKATVVKIRGFHTISVDEKAHTATCGASVDFTFTSANGKAIRNTGSIVQFQIYPAERGQIVSSTNGGAYRQIVESAQADQ